MRFFQVVLSGAALIAAALAVEFNSVPSTIEPGKTYTITYSPKTDATIILRKGDPNDLDTVTTLGSGANGEFKWTVPSDLPNAKDYALEIQAPGAEPNFSGQITLTGSSASASASGSSSASSTASASKSSSASSTSSGASTTTTKASSSASASASVSSSAGTNSTISSATLTRTSSGSPSSTASTTGSSPPNQTTNAASLLGSSPAAFILGAVAAIAYL